MTTYTLDVRTPQFQLRAPKFLRNAAIQAKRLQQTKLIASLSAEQQRDIGLYQSTLPQLPTQLW
jgi:hypothetical protein